MFLYLFTFFLILMNIYCFYTRKYLQLFFVSVLFLPEYYGVEISNSLPLITATRIMYVILYIYVFTYYKSNINFSSFSFDIKNLKKFRALSSETKFLVAYFVFRILSNLYYLPTLSSSAMTLFRIVFEQLFLCIAIYFMQLKESDIYELIKTIVYCSAILFILGIFESFTGFRITDSLYTVSRPMLNDHYIRLGLLRSTSTLGLPGIYGNYCVILMPLILFIYNETKQKRFLAIFSLNILALIHSGSRSSMIFSFLGIFLYFLLYIKTSARRKQFIKNMFYISSSLCIVILVLCLSSSSLKYYYIGTGKSILNEFGCNFDMNSEDDSDAPAYGGNNTKGSVSRTRQFSGIPYAASKNVLFGLGSKAQNRGAIYYFFANGWHQSYTYDVGYVEIFMDEGLIGSIAFCSLFISFFIRYKKNLTQGRSYDFAICISIIMYLICLLSTANMYHLLFFLWSAEFSVKPNKNFI